MKALNKQERNTAILKFTLWLMLCVIIICVPIIVTTLSSREQQKVDTGQKEALVKEATFERDYIATKVQEIDDLMQKRDAQEMIPEEFNAELVNILDDITVHSEKDTSWRGVMYGNIVSISRYLIQANKIVAASGSNKEQQAKDLGTIIFELEKLHNDLKDLNNEKKKKDITGGLDEVAGQLNIEIKKLNNFKSSL